MGTSAEGADMNSLGPVRALLGGEVGEVVYDAHLATIGVEKLTGGRLAERGLAFWEGVG